MKALVYTVDRIHQGIATLNCNNHENVCIQLDANCNYTQEIKEGDLVLVIWHQEVGGPCIIKVLTQQSKLQQAKIQGLLDNLKSKSK